MNASSRIVLGSGSRIRARILRDAGLDFDIVKPDVDERALKAQLDGEPGETVALKLAEAKALEVSAREDGLVIGADQILRFEGQLLDKATSQADARARLIAMRGKPHELVGGLVLSRAGKVLSRDVHVSKVRMRAYSDAFLDRYMAACGDAILASVACYQFEGWGAQLFERIEGDYFAILGMPLLAVLARLRAFGAIDE